MKLQSPITWLHGRADRRDYVLWVAAFYAATFAVRQWGPDLGQSLGAHRASTSLGILAVIYALSLVISLQEIRRFHDISRTGWWVLALNLPTFGVVATPVVLGLSGHPLESLHDAPIMPILRWIQIGFMVLLALPPGQRDENRFGAPQAGRPLKEIFS